ncbi:LysR family transcriptional regulator [Shinella sp.]|uniref:LysR family transcriptional regulator n=1 Tax=Shinella sp. TaxID=1870904 RepID=UPI0029A908C7|nr:LysR substrate-binding domain-containing protein [Shinella sp.]MDX3974044.1 LysR substrate-binding domain-containing protein [Shinella sp.]
MNGLADLRMFSEIARSQSMVSAANRLGMAPATISGRLKALEDHYGVALVRRTTRSLLLTEEGKLLLERARPVLSGFADLERDMGGRRTAVSGGLVLSCAADISRVQLLSLVRSFACAHPNLHFSLRFDPPGSLHEIPFDAALRVGPVRDSNLTIRKLFSMETVTCAAPAYLTGHGIPIRPADLCRHECLRLDGSAFAGNDWGFREGEGTVSVDGRFRASDPATLKNFAVQGLGILRTALADVETELASGLLVSVLGAFEPEPQTVCLLSDSRRRLPARTSEFIDFAQAHVRAPLGVRETVSMLLPGDACEIM